MQGADRRHEIAKAAIAGIAVNILLSAARLAAGFWGHSSAMLASGIHSISDLFGDSVVGIGVWIANKSHFQHREKTIEKIVSTIVGLALLFVAGDLMVDGVEEIREILSGEEVTRPGSIAIFVAALSFVLQEALFKFTSPIGKKTDSAVVTANAWHHRADALSSLGTLLAVAAARWLGNTWTILDPLVGCLLSVLVLVIAIKTILASFK